MTSTRAAALRTLRIEGQPSNEERRETERTARQAELGRWTILTSNKAFSDWTELFPDPIIVTAIPDRLLHHSVVTNIRGNSFRLMGGQGKEGPPDSTD